MQIDICPSNLLLLPEHSLRITRRVGFALSRLSARIRRVEVRLTDVNGPRGGDDKRCRVLLHLDGGGWMLVEDRGADLPGLIDRTIDRLRRVAHKRIGQLKQARHSPRTARTAEDLITAA